MDNKYFSSLCRICLEDGATLPIFDSSDNEENIISKITLCMNEKIEDIMEFPRNICVKCNETLNLVCNLIDTYKETCKILEHGYSVVKKEPLIDFENCNSASEADMELKDIKNETDCYINNEVVKLKPLQINSKKVKLKGETNNKKKLKKPKVYSGTDTNKIASSILEGEFTWTEDKWCFKIGQTTIMSKKKRAVNQKEIKKEVPKETQDTDPSKLCDLCGEVCNTSEKLLMHKKRKHLSTPIKCPKCPRTLASDYYLSLHIQRKHGGRRDFICSTCKNSFVARKELTNHIRRVHNKVLKPPRVYSCKFCEKTYKCAKSVVVHERSVHTGQRPAQCTICGSCFFHDDYLKEHMRLHTGETPYKCPVCGRGYAQRGNMKSHLRIHRISDLDAITLSNMKPNYLKLLKVS